MDDISSAIDSVLDEDINLDEWTQSIDKEIDTIHTKIKRIPFNKKSEKMEEMYAKLYSTAASVLGGDVIDKMVTASLNSCPEIKTQFCSKDGSVIIMKDGNVYSVEIPNSTDSDEEVDGHNVGVITDCQED